VARPYPLLFLMLLTWSTSMPPMEQDQEQDQPEEDNLDDLLATLDGLAEDLAALQTELDQTP
jgi:hypothetical protein